MEEVFKEIEGFPGYSVSNLGNIKNNKTEKLLKPVLSGKRYIINIFNNGKRYTKTVHRLVASAFIINPEGKPEVDHIDNNSLNNCVDNLRWATRSENESNKPTRGLIGAKGVSFDIHKNKFRAIISKNYVHKFLGYYTTIEEASEAYIIAAKEIHGEFARF
jgi:hypothetical protein